MPLAFCISEEHREIYCPHREYRILFSCIWSGVQKKDNFVFMFCTRLFQSHQSFPTITNTVWISPNLSVYLSVHLNIQLPINPFLLNKDCEIASSRLLPSLLEGKNITLFLFPQMLHDLLSISYIFQFYFRFLTSTVFWSSKF